MIRQTSTGPTSTNHVTIKLRTSKLRNRRLLRVHSGQTADPSYYEREETDVA